MENLNTLLPMPLLRQKDFPVIEDATDAQKEEASAMRLTRFMWFAFQAFAIFVAAFALVAALELKRPEKDNTVLDALIFGFATTNAGILWTKASAEKTAEAVSQTAGKTQESLNRQDVVLEQVHDKVNGGTTRIIESLKAEHDANVRALREEHARERHRIDNAKEAAIKEADLQASEWRTEAREKADQVAKLEKQVKDLTEMLSKAPPIQNKAGEGI
jgi:hypothetical protein